MYSKNKVLMGSIFCIVAACFWGISGAAGQYLFNFTGVTPEWVVSTRTIAVGIMMLTFLQLTRGSVFEIWANKEDRKGIIIFTLGGMLFMQYGYFAAIKYCNAATATVLQYTAPVMIVVYLAVKNRKLPTMVETIAVIGCLVGTILLATHGDMNNLSLSPQALFWGLLSAVALAFYTIYPTRLLMKYDTMLLIGWSMLIGSVVMHFVHPSWEYAANWDLTGILCMVFIVLFGTMTPYLLFLNGVKYIGPTKSSLYASAEPLASTIVSVVWLKVGLELIDYVGFICIVVAVLMLSLIKPKETKKALD
ncbi:MAG: EamA family transporter [Anaerotignum sp.]|nr:EamA family transporter [Anaerotignum sp.]